MDPSPLGRSHEHSPRRLGERSISSAARGNVFAGGTIRLIRINTLSKARAEPESGGFVLSYLWSTLAGLLVPALVVMVGLIAAMLNLQGLTAPTTRLGSTLSIPTSSTFASQSPLAQLTELVALTFAVAAIFSVSVWLHRRSADARASRIVKSLHSKVLKQSLRRAELEGAAAQHVRAEQLIGKHLPLVQRGLSLWYRAVPRSVLMLVGCLALALSVNVWLAMLAMVSGVLLWQLFHKLRRNDESDLADWEVPRTRRRMAELVGQAPLLARLQSQGLADHAYQAELETLYRRVADEDARLGRVWPLLFLASAAAIAVMVLGFGVNLFGVDNGLSLPSALVIGLSLTGAVAAAGRLLGLISQMKASGEASDAVYHYLHRSNDIAPSEQRVGLSGLRECVEIQDVTLGDSTGNPILSHLSLKLYPKTFVSVLGTENVSMRGADGIADGLWNAQRRSRFDRWRSASRRPPAGPRSQRHVDRTGRSDLGRNGAGKFAWRRRIDQQQRPGRGAREGRRLRTVATIA